MHGFESRGELVPRGRFVDTGRFGRMFPHLRSLKRTQEDILALAQDPRPDGSPGVMVGPGSPIRASRPATPSLASSSTTT